MSLSRKHARLIVEAFEIDCLILDDEEVRLLCECNPTMLEAYRAIVAFANDPDPMTDNEILDYVGVDYGSELAESFYECLDDPAENATKLNKWMETNGFALRVDELISMDVDGCCVWKMKETTR